MLRPFAPTNQQRAGLATGKLVFIEIAAVLIGVAAATPHILSQPQSATQGLLSAQPFSESALTKARASGKPVFLYFTADWCLTCKVNEEVAIERETTRDAFAKAGVQVLVGDWTRRDPAITRFLTAINVSIFLAFESSFTRARLRNSLFRFSV